MSVLLTTSRCILIYIQKITPVCHPNAPPPSTCIISPLIFVTRSLRGPHGRSRGVSRPWIFMEVNGNVQWRKRGFKRLPSSREEETSRQQSQQNSTEDGRSATEVEGNRREFVRSDLNQILNSSDIFENKSHTWHIVKRRVDIIRYSLLYVRMVYYSDMPGPIDFGQKRESQGTTRSSDRARLFIQVHVPFHAPCGSLC